MFPMVMLNRTVLILNMIALGLLLWALGAKYFPPPVPGAWSYADIVAVILTALGVMLSAVTLAVALVAIWGFQTIRRSAGSAALRAAQAEQKKYFESPAFQSLVVSIMQEQRRNDERDMARSRVDVELAGDGDDAAEPEKGEEETWAD